MQLQEILLMVGSMRSIMIGELLWLGRIGHRVAMLHAGADLSG